MRLPPFGDFDQHYETANYVRTVPQYELNETTGQLKIDDPVWGECTIGEWSGDEVLKELYLNPLVQRSAGIEQLTLPQHFSTMPNTTDFSRFEHIWGSVVFVRKMIEKSRLNGSSIDDREALILQLRTFVSDLGHTAFSHLGDWLFQGFGGTEDQHDEELGDLLEAGGVNEILRRHSIDPSEVNFPDTRDWIECPAPDLCVDRVDYGAREITRWVTGYEPANWWLEKFTVDTEGRIIMSDKSAAQRFAASFGLLATEHWGHPVHNLQLQLFSELIRSAVADYTNRDLHTDGIYHPRDLLYVIDSTLNTSTRAVGDLNHNLFGAMLDIARAQRKIFAHGRHDDIDFFFRELHALEWPDIRDDLKRRRAKENDIHFPDPLESQTWQSKYTGLKPANIQIIPVQTQEDVKDFNKLPHTFDVFLPPLKPRAIDPLFYGENGEVVRLSEADELWQRLMVEQKALQARGYVARLYADPIWINELKHKIMSVRDEWRKQLEFPRTSTERLALLIRDEAMMAIGRVSTIHLR